MAETQPKGERIAKRMARAGVCSRRDAEKMIEAGRVKVNGTVLTSAACVVTDRDAVMVDGTLLAAKEPTRLWRYHKPAGLVTTHRDERGRETLFDKLPADMPRVVSVGRLDLNSEGLLLLTNDGELARKLELPSNGWLRRYRVRVHGAPDQHQIDALAKGVTVEGIKYGPIVAVVDRIQGSNTWLTVSLSEGKNREIRRVMDFLNLPVSRLIRIAYGPFQLGYLAEGMVEEVPARVLRDQLGAQDAPPPIKGGGLVRRSEAPPRDRDMGTSPPARPVSARPASGSASGSGKPAASGRPAAAAPDARGPKMPVSAAKRPGSSAAPPRRNGPPRGPKKG